MKIKYILRGIGIGLIMSVLIFFMFNRNSEMNGEQNESTQQQESSETSESKLGELLNGDVTPTPAVTSANTPSVTVAVSPSKTTPTPAPTLTPIPTPITANATDSTSEKDDKNVSSKEEAIEVTIKSGTYSNTVAKQLEEYGIIDDWEEYDYYLMKNNLTKMIKADTYQIEKGLSFEEITNIITKR